MHRKCGQRSESSELILRFVAKMYSFPDNLRSPSCRREGSVNIPPTETTEKRFRHIPDYMRQTGGSAARVTLNDQRRCGTYGHQAANQVVGVRIFLFSTELRRIQLCRPQDLQHTVQRFGHRHRTALLSRIDDVYHLHTSELKHEPTETQQTMHTHTHTLSCTLVMGASIVMEWILAIDECLL